MKLVTTMILSAAFALALAACGTSEKKAATEHPTGEHPAATPPADGAAATPAEHPAGEHPAATPPAADAPKAR